MISRTYDIREMLDSLVYQSAFLLYAGATSFVLSLAYEDDNITSTVRLELNERARGYLSRLPLTHFHLTMGDGSFDVTISATTPIALAGKEGSPLLPSSILDRSQTVSAERIPPGQLPLFVGREEELRLLSALRSAGNRLVHITGDHGIGKTALALEFARRNVEQFPGGIIISDIVGAWDSFIRSRASDMALVVADDVDRLSATVLSRLVAASLARENVFTVLVSRSMRREILTLPTLSLRALKYPISVFTLKTLFLASPHVLESFAQDLARITAGNMRLVATALEAASDNAVPNFSQVLQDLTGTSQSRVLARWTAGNYLTLRAPRSCSFDLNDVLCRPSESSTGSGCDLSASLNQMRRFFAERDLEAEPVPAMPKTPMRLYYAKAASTSFMFALRKEGPIFGVDLIESLRGIGKGPSLVLSVCALARRPRGASGHWQELWYDISLLSYVRLRRWLDASDFQSLPGWTPGSVADQE